MTLNNAGQVANRIVWWILGALLAALLAVTSFVWTNLDSEVRRVSAVQAVRGERITAVESQARQLEQQMAEIRVGLRRLDEKIDRVLEWQRRQP